MAYYDDYLDYLQSLADDSISSSTNAIYKAMNTGIEGYNNTLKESNKSYDDLADNSELSRYRARKQQRTNQDQYGTLTSGLGRQERLYLDTQYGNQLMDILAQKQSAKDKVEQSINELKANAEQSIADVKNSFANQISSIMAQMAAYNVADSTPSYSSGGSSGSSGGSSGSSGGSTKTTPTYSSVGNLVKNNNGTYNYSNTSYQDNWMKKATTTAAATQPTASTKKATTTTTNKVASTPANSQFMQSISNYLKK